MSFREGVNNKTTLNCNKFFFKFNPLKIQSKLKNSDMLPKVCVFFTFFMDKTGFSVTGGGGGLITLGTFLQLIVFFIIMNAFPKAKCAYYKTCFSVDRF